MQDQPNAKLCECGCGRVAPLAPYNRAALGWIKGHPRRFLSGHARRVSIAPPNPLGLCMCGCGLPAPIAKGGSRRTGHVAGEHVRFISGHNARGSRASAEKRRKTSEGKRGDRNPSWVGEAVSYSALHTWLLRHHPKTGVCEECGKTAKTQHAFLRHPARHTRNREDYAELCPACHIRLDAPLRAAGVKTASRS